MTKLYRSCLRLTVIVLAMLVASQTAAQTLGKPAAPLLRWNSVTDRHIGATHDRPNGATFTCGFTASNRVN